jgi:transposase
MFHWYPSAKQHIVIFQQALSSVPVALSFTLLVCVINFSAGSLKKHYLNRKIYKYERHYVENKPQIMQRVLKMQYISLLLKYMTLISRSVFPCLCLYVNISLLKGDWLNPLSPELNPICYLLALLGAHDFLHISRIRVKSLTIMLLMSYTYGAPILDVSRSHTTMQHSR